MSRAWTRSGVTRVAAAALLGLAGFWLSRPVEAASSPVTIQNFAFAPQTLTISVGTSVTWTNLDAAPHTSTSDPNSAVSWNSGSLGTNGSYSFTFTQTGTFTYHCAIHPFMQGSIVVQGAGANATNTPLPTLPPPPTPPTTLPTLPPPPTGGPLATIVSTDTPTATAIPTSAPPAKKAAKKSIVAKLKGQRFIFSPSSTTIKKGTKVTWANQSQAPHTVTSDTKGWKFNKSLDKKAITFTFSKPGTYRYHCRFHPGMNGKIVVKK